MIVFHRLEMVVALLLKGWSGWLLCFLTSENLKKLYHPGLQFFTAPG
jgi:hypothetical protein